MIEKSEHCFQGGIALKYGECHGNTGEGIYIGEVAMGPKDTNMGLNSELNLDSKDMV
jgi:hypothetical protein